MRLADATTKPQGVRRLLHYRWVVFATVGLNGVLLYFHFAWGATLSGYHTIAWNLNAPALGLLSALGFFLYALMQIPGGYLTDLLGVRKTMSAAMAFLALGTVVFAGAPTFAVAVIGRMLIGLASGVILLPSLKVLARWFREREFATVQGVFIFLSTIGSLAATLPLAIAAERWGWRTPMFAAAGLMALAAAATWTLVRNDPTDLGLAPISAIDPDAMPHGGDIEAERPSLRMAFRAWRRIPTLWATSVMFFATYGSSQAFQALWAGPLLRQGRGLTTAETDILLLLFTLGTGLGPAVFGFVSDRIVGARKPVVIFSAIGQTALWILVILAFDRLPLLLLHVVFVALGTLGGGVLVAQVMIKELCPPRLFGTVFGIHNGAGFYGTAVIQLITGSVLNAIGPVTVGAEPIYSARAYTLALSPIIGFMLIAAALSFRLVETLGARRILWPSQIS